MAKKFYGMDMKGILLVRKVSSLPTFQSSDQGGLIYNETNEQLYFGDSTGWVEIVQDDGKTYDNLFAPAESTKYGTSVPPVADFSGSPLSGVEPLTVNFTNLTSGYATDYEWDFQNNGSVDSVQENPSFEYTVAGTYTVKLTAKGTGTSDSETKVGYITVAVPCQAFNETAVYGFITYGTAGSFLLTTHQRYYTTGNSWSKRTAALTPARVGNSFALGNAVYSAVAGSTTQRNEVYTNSVNSWAIDTNTPSPGRANCVSTTGIRASTYRGYLCNGNNGSTYLQDNDEFTYSSHTWSSRANHTLAIVEPAFTDIDGLPHTFGGSLFGGTIINSSYEFDPDANSWTGRANTPSVKFEFTACDSDCKAYLMNGAIGSAIGSQTNDNWEYDPDTNSFSIKTNASQFVRGNQATRIGSNYIYNHQGGRDNVGAYPNVHQRYNPTGNSWATMAAHVNARSEGLYQG
jgi:PKD repeat protein